jgi:hypothetical protein
MDKIIIYIISNSVAHLIYSPKMESVMDAKNGKIDHVSGLM